MLVLLLSVVFGDSEGLPKSGKRKSTYPSLLSLKALQNHLASSRALSLGQCLKAHAKWHQVQETVSCLISCDFLRPQTLEITAANENLGQKSAKNNQRFLICAV